MKIYINNRNYLTWPKAMAAKLARQGHEVIFVDNLSTYPPLVEWYATCPYKVILLPKNAGNTAPWREGIVDTSEDYVVTDPDLDITDLPDDWPDVLKEGLYHYYGYTKVGLSLDSTKVPSMNPSYEADEFCRYPDGNHPFWWGTKEEIDGRTWYAAYTDTTFALYRAGTTVHTIDGVRADRPYTARHLPWHVVEKLNPAEDSLQIKLDREIAYYFKNATHVSESKKRMERMVGRYALQE